MLNYTLNNLNKSGFFIAGKNKRDLSLTAIPFLYARKKGVFLFDLIQFIIFFRKTFFFLESFFQRRIKVLILLQDKSLTEVLSSKIKLFFRTMKRPERNFYLQYILSSRLGSQKKKTLSISNYSFKYTLSLKLLDVLGIARDKYRSEKFFFFSSFLKFLKKRKRNVYLKKRYKRKNFGFSKYANNGRSISYLPKMLLRVISKLKLRRDIFFLRGFKRGNSAQGVFLDYLILVRQFFFFFLDSLSRSLDYFFSHFVVFFSPDLLFSLFFYRQYLYKLKNVYLSFIIIVQFTNSLDSFKNFRYLSNFFITTRSGRRIISLTGRNKAFKDKILKFVSSKPICRALFFNVYKENFHFRLQLLDQLRVLKNSKALFYSNRKSFRSSLVFSLKMLHYSKILERNVFSILRSILFSFGPKKYFLRKSKYSPKMSYAQLAFNYRFLRRHINYWTGPWVHGALSNFRGLIKTFNRKNPDFRRLGNIPGLFIFLYLKDFNDVFKEVLPFKIPIVGFFNVHQDVSFYNYGIPSNNFNSDVGLFYFILTLESFFRGFLRDAEFLFR